MAQDPPPPKSEEERPPIFLCSVMQERMIFVLSKKAMDLLRKGCAVLSPDNRIMVTYSHNMEETMAQVQQMFETTGRLDEEIMDFIVTEGARPPKRKRKPKVLKEE